MIYRTVKRLLDITGSLLCLVLLSPLMLWITLRVRRTMGSPAIFSQERAGEGGKAFTLYKYRTMTDERDEAGDLLPDEKRLTPFGRWLRSTSLDELPQLWNILRKEMSFVGPRPLLLEYVPLYDDRQRRRLDVPPGVTGWAQVNGRNAISWPRKFELDVWYVDNRSLSLDAKILLLTITKAVAREGISASGEATMPRFTGNEVDERDERAKGD